MKSIILGFIISLAINFDDVYASKQPIISLESKQSKEEENFMVLGRRKTQPYVLKIEFERRRIDPVSIPVGSKVSGLRRIIAEKAKVPQASLLLQIGENVLQNDEELIADVPGLNHETIIHAYRVKDIPLGKLHAWLSTKSHKIYEDESAFAISNEDGAHLWIQCNQDGKRRGFDVQNSGGKFKLYAWTVSKGEEKRQLIHGFDTEDKFNIWIDVKAVSKDDNPRIVLVARVLSKRIGLQIFHGTTEQAILNVFDD